MSESYIALPPDSSGKKIRSILSTIGANEVYEEVVQIFNTIPVDIQGASLTVNTIDMLKSGTIIVSNTVPVTGEFTISTIDLLKDGSITVLNPVNTIIVSNPVNTVQISNPVNTVNVSNYSGTVTVSNSYGTVQVSNPIGTVEISNPVNTIIIANPVNTVLVSNTISANILNSGIGIHCASINVGNSTVAVVDAVASKMIKVYNILMIANAASSVTWLSNNSLLSGTMVLNTTGAGYAQVVNPPAYLITSAVGQTLRLAVLGGTVAGYLSYWDNDSE